MFNDCISSTYSNALPIVLLDNNRTNMDATNSDMDIAYETIYKKSCDENDQHHYKSLNTCKSLNIYRYKFSDTIIQLLYSFSKIHQYDDRISFKEAWNFWLDENNELVEGEIRRLKNIDYEGDVKEKMFKSARYYFRKKNTEKKEPKKRGNYTNLNKELLEAIDHHIEVNVNFPEFKPSTGFHDFCNSHSQQLIEEIQRLKEKIVDNEVIKNKIKKTYKNRYFILLNANKNANKNTNKNTIKNTIKNT